MKTEASSHGCWDLLRQHLQAILFLFLLFHVILNLVVSADSFEMDQRKMELLTSAFLLYLSFFYLAGEIFSPIDELGSDQHAEGGAVRE